MAATSVFDAVCSEVAEATALSDLESRGTIRIALREAGLEAKTLTKDQIIVTLRKVMPRELEARGIDASVCEHLVTRMQALELDESEARDTPESVFERLGGR